MNKEKLNAIFDETRVYLAESMPSRMQENMKNYTDENGKLGLEELAAFCVTESMSISMDYIEMVLSKVLLEENK